MENDTYARKLLSATRLCAFCAVVVLIALFVAGAALLPRAFMAIDSFNQAAAQFNTVDWTKLTEDVGKAADCLSQVDFNKLHHTIEELQNAINPLAELFGG